MSPVQPISFQWSSVDVEAQTQTIPGTQTSFSFTTAPPVPEPTHSSARLSSQSTDTIGNCIEATPLASPTKADMVTHGSQHDVRLPKTSFPPPYSNAQLYDNELPAYDETPDADTASLAEKTFKIGFLFPPFWIMGIIILFTPLSVSSDFLAHESHDKRQELLTAMRAAEVKWAKRCAWAFAVFVVLMCVIVGTAVGVLKNGAGM